MLHADHENMVNVYGHTAKNKSGYILSILHADHKNKVGVHVHADHKNKVNVLHALTIYLKVIFRACHVRVR